ncbi:MAG: Spy/CpxP family protein refolding chaperone [Thiomonas sp.]|uniref:Spy/CpxP family protein refolding chaperone n=1 Tax=Thiomonas sp. TaxID=2047785 RepID=UPI002A369CC3|nr:Spy/CpxP family protein refolding chaperone [Thiomonas sp.]MDY0330143.1 Spy/CpxP family protein refolding chaperone [Thiomonas sp.]
MNPQTSRASTSTHISRLRRALGMVGAAVVVAVASHAALASAQTPSPDAPMLRGGMGGKMGHYGPGERGIERMLSQVDVSPEQREKMRALQKQSWEKARPEMEQMRELMQQRMKLLAAPQIDRGALEALRDKQMALANQLSRNRTQTQYEMAQILSPEQRAKLYTLMENRMKRMEHRHGSGMGRMGGPGMMQ